MGVVDAKLKVYRKYKQYIEANDIILHHVYEHFDELAKVRAYRRVTSYCNFLRSFVDKFPTELINGKISNSINELLTQPKIREICAEEIIVYKTDLVGSVYSVPYYCYSAFTVQQIKKSLVNQTLTKAGKALASKICRDILQYIEDLVSAKLSEEFRSFGFQMSDALHHVFVNVLVGAIFIFFTTLSEIFVSIFTFIFRIFSPVDVNSIEWRGKVADEIYENIEKKRPSIHQFARNQIQKFRQRTVDDLETILLTLDDFTKQVKPMDTRKRKYLKLLFS